MNEDMMLRSKDRQGTFDLKMSDTRSLFTAEAGEVSQSFAERKEPQREE